MKIKSVFIYNVDIDAKLHKNTESKHYEFENPINLPNLIESMELIRIGHAQFDPYSENPIRFGVITDNDTEVRTPDGADDIGLIRALLSWDWR